MTGNGAALISGALRLHVGGLAAEELRDALRRAGVFLNVYAETLLDHPVFSSRVVEEVAVVERSIEDLGLGAGASLSEIFAAARKHGLALCPPDTGPYLRLALLRQPDAPDSMLSTGRSPSGSLKVASAPLRDDDAYPKGFYLRAVDGRLWLRGYCCDDEYRFPSDQRFVFRRP